MTLKEFLDSLGEEIRKKTFRVRLEGKVVGYFRNCKMMIPEILANKTYVSLDYETYEIDEISQKVFCITVK